MTNHEAERKAREHIGHAMEFLFLLTSEQRLDLFDMLANSYCKHCGDALRGRICYCWRDE